MSSHQQQQHQPNMEVVESNESNINSNSKSAAAPATASPDKSKKRALTLDLNHLRANAPSSSSSSGSSSNSLTISNNPSDLKASPGFILTSPDIQMLQLASPDLEKFIIQGLIASGQTQTPTPTQLIFPKTVTEEQESYAKGFVDALNALHRSGLGGAGMSYNVVNAQTGNVSTFPINNLNGQSLFPQFFTMPQQQQFHQPIQIQTQQLQLQQQQQQHPLQSNTNEQQQHVHIHAKLEQYSPAVSPVPSDPQTVPSDRVSTKSSNSSSGTASGAPIDMDDQHRKKIERKRERNRLAAAKCRMRKLERIAVLEDRVRELKEQNNDLSNSAGQLREELENVRQELLRHVTSGCSIDMSASLMQSLRQVMNNS